MSAKNSRPNAILRAEIIPFSAGCLSLSEETFSTDAENSCNLLDSFNVNIHAVGQGGEPFGVPLE